MTSDEHTDEHTGEQADPTPPEVGSTAEEAVKLLGALTDWARDQSGAAGEGEGRAAAGIGSSLGSSLGAVFGAHVDTGAPECSWCPVCRTVHVVRNTSPEVRTHLVAAASSLLQAAAGLLEAATAAPEPGRSRSVERIDLDSDDGTHDSPEDVR